jgi:hypothetical protein
MSYLLILNFSRADINFIAKISDTIFESRLKSLNGMRGLVRIHFIAGSGALGGWGIEVLSQVCILARPAHTLNEMKDKLD